MALLIPLGLLAIVASVILWAHPELLARRNFPFNLQSDQSEPRRWIASAPFAAFGLVLIILGIVAW